MNYCVYWPSPARPRRGMFPFLLISHSGSCFPRRWGDHVIPSWLPYCVCMIEEKSGIYTLECIRSLSAPDFPGIRCRPDLSRNRPLNVFHSLLCVDVCFPASSTSLLVCSSCGRFVWPLSEGELRSHRNLCSYRHSGFLPHPLQLTLFAESLL